MTLPTVLAELKKRPGMYLPTNTYEAAVAFLLGYDAALKGGLLWAFREWLIIELKEGNNLSWPALVEILVRRQVGVPTPESANQAIDLLFVTVDEFLRDRNKINGARTIYATYELWLKDQDWQEPV